MSILKRTITTISQVIVSALLLSSTAVFGQNLTSCGPLTQANTTYVLQNDVSSSGTCMVIAASNITLDLNGHTITYDNSAPVVVPNGGFENSGGWDTTNAPNAARTAGTFISPVSRYSGNYAMRFPTGSTQLSAQYVTSTGTVTLEPNTTYSLSGMVYNTVSDSIAMSIEFAGTSIAATKTSSGLPWNYTYRGFQYYYTTFTTGSTPVTYNIVAKITGAQAASGYIYFDDISVQKHKVYGVAIGPASWEAANYPGVTIFGNALNTKITNGSIVQGQDKGSYSHAIRFSDAAGRGGVELSYLNLTSSGANARAIECQSSSPVNNLIHHNTISNSQFATRSRDNFTGAAVYFEYGASLTNKFYNNTITSGIQTGIYTKGADVFDNTIALQTIYTNDFAIVNSGGLIHGNTIECGSGNNSCRGIAGGGTGTKVYNNTISVQSLPRNQEYDGCPMSGAYGIQTETAINTEVYGNTVTAYAGECNSVAYRANPFENDNSSTNNLVHDNTFTAIASGSGRASTLALNGVTNAGLSLYNNILKTNRRWIYVSGAAISNFTMTGNRWETSGTVDTPFYPFEVYTYNNTHYTGIFINNFYGPGDQAKFEDEVFRAANGTIDPLSSFEISSSSNPPPANPKGVKRVY